MKTENGPICKFDRKTSRFVILIPIVIGIGFTQGFRSSVGFSVENPNGIAVIPKSEVETTKHTK